MVPDDSPDGGDASSTNPVQPLYDPDGYFRARAPDLSIGRALVVVGVSALVATAVFGGGLWFVTREMTGTITVDNPERPPDWVCQQEDPPEGFGENCDAPERVEKRIGDLLWSAVDQFVALAFVGICLLWPVWGFGLHVVSRLANGSGSLKDSFVIGAWGVVPSTVSTVGGIVKLWEAFVGPDLSASTPEQLTANVTAATQGVRGGPIGIALMGFGFLLTAWQAYVWTYGLHHAHDVPKRRALVAAGGFALLAYLVGLLG